MLEAELDLSLSSGSSGAVRNLFVGKEESTPDDCVTIFDTPGFPPMLTLNDQGYYYPTIQIRVRSRKYVDGYALAQKIQSALHGRAQETWNDTLYTVIYCSGDIALLDWDDKGRPRFVINFYIQRR
jgi:hypothetical protein